MSVGFAHQVTLIRLWDTFMRGQTRSLASGRGPWGWEDRQWVRKQVLHVVAGALRDVMGTGPAMLRAVRESLEKVTREVMVPERKPTMY